MSGHRGESGYHFKASERFNYGKHGFKAFSWTHRRWSSQYHCYCYWAPSFGWCFFEPIHACYVPLTYFREVYPETVTTVAPVVAPTPSVIQQTTVVTAPPAPVREVPPPAPAPAVVPAPTAVQKTNVGAGGP
jgi:hypothetical protein